MRLLNTFLFIVILIVLVVIYHYNSSNPRIAFPLLGLVFYSFVMILVSIGFGGRK